MFQRIRPDSDSAGFDLTDALALVARYRPVYQIVRLPDELRSSDGPRFVRLPADVPIRKEIVVALLNDCGECVEFNTSALSANELRALKVAEEKPKEWSESYRLNIYS